MDIEPRMRKWQSHRKYCENVRNSCGGSSRQSTEWEESLCRTFARIATVSRWMTAFGGYRRDAETATTERRSTTFGGAQSVEKNTNGERPTEYWWYSSVSMHVAPLGLCDNLINALKLLADQQKDGDIPIQSIVTGLHERSRRGIMDGLRRFTQADDHSAVDVGDLRQGTRSLEVHKPQFSETFPEAAVREGADELSLRAHEVETLRAMRTGMFSAKQSAKE